MQVALHNLGLFRVTMGRETEPRNIFFHLQGLRNLEEDWDKIEYLFGKQYDIRGNIFKSELISLPIFILNIPILRKATCISSLQSVQLKGVRIWSTRNEESIFLYADKSIPQEAMQVPANKNAKPIQFTIICQFKPFHLDMYTFSNFVTPGQTSLDKIQREQCYDSMIYVETQFLLVYNGDQIRLVASLNKALIPC